MQQTFPDISKTCKFGGNISDRKQLKEDVKMFSVRGGEISQIIFAVSFSESLRHREVENGVTTHGASKLLTH